MRLLSLSVRVEERWIDRLLLIRAEAQKRTTACMCSDALTGTSGALRRAPPPHGVRPLLGLTPRHIFAVRHGKYTLMKYFKASFFIVLGSLICYAISVFVLISLDFSFQYKLFSEVLHIPIEIGLEVIPISFFLATPVFIFFCFILFSVVKRIMKLAGSTRTALIVSAIYSILVIFTIFIFRNFAPLNAIILLPFILIVDYRVTKRTA